MSGIGNAAVTTGFPRLRTLITNGRSQANILRLYLKKHLAHNEQNAVHAARHIKNINLEQLIIDRETIDIANIYDFEWFALWQSVFNQTLFAPENYHVYLPKVGVLNLNKAATFGLCTTPDILQHICNEIQTHFPGLIVAIPSVSCLEVPQIFLFVTNDNVLQNKHGHNMLADAFVRKILREVPEYIEVNGVSGVTDIFVRGGPHAANTDDFMVQQGFASPDEYFVETNGGDITECFMAAADLLDEHRSMPTNPSYAGRHFGVEACRQIMLVELRKVLADTSHIDSHHVTLLVDCMLQTGALVSVTRQSQQKARFSGVLDIATFEQGIKVMTNAALKRTVDDLQGTSARIAVGEPVNAGTGFFKLLVDPKIDDSQMQNSTMHEIFKSIGIQLN